MSGSFDRPRCSLAVGGTSFHERASAAFVIRPSAFGSPVRALTRAPVAMVGPSGYAAWRPGTAFGIPALRHCRKQQTPAPRRKAGVSTTERNSRLLATTNDAGAEQPEPRSANDVGSGTSIGVLVPAAAGRGDRDGPAEPARWIRWIGLIPLAADRSLARCQRGAGESRGVATSVMVRDRSSRHRCHAAPVRAGRPR